MAASAQRKPNWVRQQSLQELAWVTKFCQFVSQYFPPFATNREGSGLLKRYQAGWKKRSTGGSKKGVLEVHCNSRENLFKSMKEENAWYVWEIILWLKQREHEDCSRKRGQTAKSLLKCHNNGRHSGKILGFGARAPPHTVSVNLGKLDYFLCFSFLIVIPCK